VLLGRLTISKDPGNLHLLTLDGGKYVFLSTRMNGVTLQTAVVLTLTAKRAVVFVPSEVRPASVSVSAHSGTISDTPGF